MSSPKEILHGSSVHAVLAAAEKFQQAGRGYADELSASAEPEARPLQIGELKFQRARQMRLEKVPPRGNMRLDADEKKSKNHFAVSDADGNRSCAGRTACAG